MNPIEIKNLSFAYPDGKDVLKNLTFDVAQGCFLAVAGPNGAGKSTLLKLICSVLKPSEGSITINGNPLQNYSVEQLARKIAIVRQEFAPVFDFSVIQTVLMARTPYLGNLSFETKDDYQIAFEALEATETADLAQRPLSHLSSGERQRVFIARALAQQTPILLLDEPTSSLDLRHQVGVYDLLKKLQLKENKTIVSVTHDLNLAAQYCDKILMLARDFSFHIGSSADIFAGRHIQDVFGIEGFTGTVGAEKFFLPLGKSAKDAGKISRN